MKTPHRKHSRMPWFFKMALRDSRNHWGRIFLYMSSIIVGTAAVAAIASLGENLQSSINQQSKTLLGADLSVRSQRPFSEATNQFLDSLSRVQSDLLSFSSMVAFPRQQKSRLASIRALSGDFPYYGELATLPEQAAESIKNGMLALVDDGLMLQYGISTGDTIRIGQSNFVIAGRLLKLPGEAPNVSLISPRVIIDKKHVAATGLIQVGSRVGYQRYLKFNKPVDWDVLNPLLRKRLIPNKLTFETIETRKERIVDTMQNLYRFLSLVGFIALVLGCIGVASAIHIYVKQKVTTVAILHCLGAKTHQTFSIYVVQALFMGAIGSIAGASIGALFQLLLPTILGDFIPVDLKVTIAPGALLHSIIIGITASLLAALLPLQSIRNVSPLQAIRLSFENTASRKVNFQRGLIVTAFLVFLGIYSAVQAPIWYQGPSFVGFLIFVFFVLMAAAKVLRATVRKGFSYSAPYIWRQGLANLYRPNNQTLTMIVALGLGAFLINTLYLTQDMLLQQVSLSGADSQANMVLFDIQTDQRDGVSGELRKEKMPILQNVPIVTMRIRSINGITTGALLADSTNGIPAWTLRREYRSSYRDTLISTEEILAGKLGQTIMSDTDSIFISMEESIVASLNLKLADEIVFDVQGFPITTWLGSIRKVNWRRVQPNFFILFPGGVLEDAPQTHVLVTKSKSKKMAGILQNALIKKFPNVSIIDLRLILETIDAILSKVSFAIQFMALFSILTGLTVLVSAILTSRFQRTQEIVLLRTLGASRRQVIKIALLEYFFLGGLAALAGILLSLLAAWILGKLFFSVDYMPQLSSGLITFACITITTILIGMLNSQAPLKKPPLEILRNEG